MTEEDAISQFLSAGSRLEKYLQDGKPLTTQQLESLSVAVSGLHTFLDSWKRKYGQKKQEIQSSPGTGDESA